MRLKSAPPDLRNQMFHRRESDGRLVEVGVHPVLHGYRVRAGFVGSFGLNLDWCAGSDWSEVQRLYALAVACLEQREENMCCFDGLPGASRTKPYFKDAWFVEKIVEAAGPSVTLIVLDQNERTKEWLSIPY